MLEARNWTNCHFQPLSGGTEHCKGDSYSCAKCQHGHQCELWTEYIPRHYPSSATADSAAEKVQAWIHASFLNTNTMEIPQQRVGMDLSLSNKSESKVTWWWETVYEKTFFSFENSIVATDVHPSLVVNADEIMIHFVPGSMHHTKEANKLCFMV